MTTRIAAPRRGPRIGAVPIQFNTLIADVGARLALRRIAIFLALLLSGGNPLFPRTTLFVALIAVAMALRFPSALIERPFARIWLVLVGLVAVAIVGLSSGYGDGVAGRLGSVGAGLLVLSIYLGERPSQLADDLLPILRLMAVQALLTPVLALLVPAAFMSLSVGEGTDLTYRTLLFVFTYHDTAFGAALIKRPDGFFWEPGVFQIYLNIYLFIAAFMAGRWRDMALAIAAVLTLQSTTGLLITCLIMGVFFARRWYLAGAIQKAAIIIFGLILATPLVIVTSANLEDKLFGASRGSGIARMFDVSTGLNVVAEYPLAGLGFDAQRYSDVSYRLADRTSDLRSDRFLLGRATSNGIIEMLTMVGIPLSMIFFFGMFRQRFFPHRILFGLLILLSLTGEALVFTPFFIMIIFSGLLIAARPRAG